MSKENTPLQKARQYCEMHQLRFTKPRQYVLEILFNHQKPMGAYDILKALAQFIDNPKPPTAYRAIDFWREHGFVHKVESQNTFVACGEDHNHSDTHFLVCDDCNDVKELHLHHDEAQKVYDGFISKRTVTETHGTCGDCAQDNQDNLR